MKRWNIDIYKRLGAKQSRGFTLTELSIVIVIIGLLTASVIVGDGLVTESRTLAVIKEEDYYRVAIASFAEQYNALPGDMINATAYWYNASTCPGTTGVAGGCNGNGNGIIEYSGENGRAWQHLKFAGIIQGSYNGTAPNPPQPGTSAPSSKFSSDATWDFYQSPLYLGVTCNAFWYVSSRGAYPNNTILGLKPLFAYSIDNKIDDGNYNTGRVISYYVVDGVNFTTATGCITSTGAYNISGSQANCSMQFIIDIPG